MESVRLQKRGIERRNAVLESAIALFAEKGYEKTSIQDVVRRAGGSNSLIYRTYGNKEGLFSAAVEFLIRRIFERSEEEERTGGTLREELQRYGERILSAFLEPQALALYRLIVEESGRSKRLSRTFHEEGMCRSYGYVRPILLRHTSLGEERIAELSAFFVESLKSNRYHRALLLGETPDPEEIRRDAALAVEILLAHVERAGPLR